MKVFKPVNDKLSMYKDRFKMVIFVTKIFTFMMKLSHAKIRKLKEENKLLKEALSQKYE